MSSFALEMRWLSPPYSFLREHITRHKRAYSRTKIEATVGYDAEIANDHFGHRHIFLGGIEKAELLYLKLCSSPSFNAIV